MKTFEQFSTEAKVRKMGAPRGAPIVARSVTLPENQMTGQELADGIAKVFPDIVQNTTSQKLSGTGILERLKADRSSVSRDLSDKLRKAIGYLDMVTPDWSRAKLHWEIRPQTRDQSKAAGEFRLLIPYTKVIDYGDGTVQERKPDMPIEAKVQFFEDGPQGDWKAILVQ